MKTRDNYTLLGLIIGLVLGGLLGLLLHQIMRQSHFLWLAAVGAGMGLWLGALVDRSQFRPR